ncbi:MAG: DNA polymerase III subunit gamma/tau [Oxalicibacterium faecigallinarum]|uniref:DNA polymerase III subunit gamma/tau n=1 Tax=Oxalicibacterium faecigallinarum TaxID=573741 RepID=UPI002809D34F|nr:DNA polymerase III subunit gamma/tau [Oxalicibacterium faecigallinarum]MDQ7968365.1 DNA polymerase III subunit gamma/tau [Oxalicibacterium faecigallinarum]
MSYQVLARKYRPKSFDTLVGQEHVVRALTHALDNQRLHHAYLFTGTRGVGKTTLSRILAKSFNCVGPDGNGGITATPCGVCEACVAIDAGRFVDYIEMDAASNRGVDEMAQLLEQAIYAPSNARFKVYMIDEVHMLTNHAFNAMLKTLEEPPEHIKFILATTDPQKIPVTVLSRCLQFNLKQMPPGHIVSHLENILGQEQIEFETPALRLLAQGAHGSMRDALSLTDQAIAYAAGKVTLDAVQGMLGALDQSFLVRILDALAEKDGAGLLAVADEMATRSLSYNAALQDLGSLLHRVALAQSVPAAVPDDLPEREDILRLAGLFDAEEIQLFYQIAVHGRNELGLAPDEYAGFSMTLLRMLAFRPGFGPASARPVGNAAPAATAAARPAASAAPAATARLSAAPQVATTSAPLARPGSAGGVSPARAALEAARAGMKGGTSSTRPPVPAVNAAVAAPVAVTSSVPAVRTSPAFDQAPPMDLPDLPPAPPWDDGADMPPVQSGRHEDFAPPAAAQKKTEVLNATADAPMQRGQSADKDPVRPFVLHPIDGLAWDGNWPVLAATLPVRGVAQQLAQQSELMGARREGNTIQLDLQVSVETLLAAGSVDKLIAALSDHFGQTVRINSKLGPVQHTANAAAMADRAERQREAEQSMQDFGATIVPGSVRPI